MHNRTLTVALAGRSMLGAVPAIATDFAVDAATVQQLLSAYLLRLG